jgi:hypothetical protein
MGRTLFLLVLAAAAGSASCSRSPSELSASPEPLASTPAPLGSMMSPHGANAHMPHPPIPAASGAPRGALALQWNDPPRWHRRLPSTPMRSMEYGVPRTGSDAEDAECFVVTFGQGQGGSIEDNIQRWVKQLEPASSAVERTKRTVNGMSVTRVEVAGTFTPMAMPTMPAAGAPKQGWRLVGDIVEAPSGLWFFKMTGPDATVKAAAKELDGLIDSVRPS